MGTTSLSSAQALSETSSYGAEVREARSDLTALGLPGNVAVSELNFSWRYDDGTPGGNKRFFAAVSSVWMASALGHILRAGGRAMPYATQNGPLGLTVEPGMVNPDGRATSTPLPAYWGVAAWTGARKFPGFSNGFVNVINQSDALVETSAAVRTTPSKRRRASPTLHRSRSRVVARTATRWR